MIAAGQTRTVNHAKFTGPETAPIDVVYYSNEAYYYKITGLLVESIITDTQQNGIKHTWNRTLYSTTAFTGLNSTGPTILPSEETNAATPITAAAIAFIAVTVVAVAIITQHRKQKTTTR